MTIKRILNRTSYLVAGGLLATLVLVAGCGTTISPGQRGLKYIALDGEGLKHEVRPDGFYWQWPWNDIVSYDVTLQTKDEAVEVLTEDDLHVPVTASVTFRPQEDKLYDLHTKIGPEYYDKIIRPTFMTLVRSEFAHYKHNDLAEKSPEIERAILAKLSESIAGKPLEIDRISIKHIRFDQKVTAAISQKLAMEQEAEQKRFELEIAKQDAEIARAAAKGRGDAVRIAAAGEAEAVVIKGKAQSEAQAEITKTLTPAYLQYKAFDGTNTRYYFVPVGRDGMPIIINAEGSAGPRGATGSRAPLFSQRP